MEEKIRIVLPSLLLENLMYMDSTLVTVYDRYTRTRPLNREDSGRKDWSLYPYYYHERSIPIRLLTYPGNIFADSIIDLVLYTSYFHR